MASWAYQSSGSVATSGSGAALSPGAPSGLTAGDLLILHTGQRTAGAAGPGSITGWTLLVSFGYSGGAVDMWGRIATAEAADTPSVDWDGTNWCYAWIERYTGGGYTDLSTIVAHSATDFGSRTGLLIPALASPTVANCHVIASSNRNNTVTDATTISISGALTKRGQSVATAASRLHAASASAQQTTATSYSGPDFTINGTSESLTSRGVLVYLRTSSARSVKLLAHSSAASATGVEGVVLNSTRDTVIGEFTGQAFEAALEGSPGEAVLLIPVADIIPDGSTLTTSDTPIVFAYNATDSIIGPGSATVIEV